MNFVEARSLNGVYDFHKLFELPVEVLPKIPSDDRCKLRIALLQEELDELKDAIQQNDIVAAADAFADLQYVLSGAILEFGLGAKFSELFEEVQMSNMSKACVSYEDAIATQTWYAQEKQTESFIIERDGRYLVYRNSDKKVLKSISYTPADFNAVLSKR